MITELVVTMVIKPFSLLKLTCITGVRATSLVINAWVEILSSLIFFNVSMFWRLVLWTLSIITLPVRAIAALHREKQLQAQLSDLQHRLDSLAWDKKELREHIRMAINEHEMMEMMLGELEEEHDEAIRKIKLLLTELQDLKDENFRLKELHGKSQWDTDTRVDSIYGCDDQNLRNSKTSNAKDGISPWKSSRFKATGILKQNDIVKNNDGPFMPPTGLRKQREVALSQSVFSAMLSLLVGMIIYEAQEPCMPLVMALFIVVGMSLKSVVQFFSTIKNKPASEAVALLSLNWFILGTLTYPTLPRVARLTAPFFTKSLEQTLCWFFFRLHV